MNRQRLIILAIVTAVALGAAAWLSMHRAAEQTALGGGSVFPDLRAALNSVEEVRLSKGDGSKVTLRKGPDSWQVVERQYPADPGRVRELLLGLANLQIVEHKTSDPANYAKLGVEAAASATASSTLVEVVGGGKSWALLVGRNAGAKGVYARKPSATASALVAPAISADPDQKRWLDRQLIDVPAAAVHEIAVDPADGPDYLLSRSARDQADFTLSPVPRGRKPANAGMLNSQADALTAFHFDDLHARAADAAAATSRATFRTFDGKVIEFAGRKDGERSLITVTARQDDALAARFAPPPAATAPADAAVAPAATPGAQSPASATNATPADAGAPAARTVDVERLNARTQAVEYEIPAYKYDSIFKPHADLLEPPETPEAKQK